MGFARTAILLAALTALFLTAGFLLGGRLGLMLAFGLAVAMNVYAYWNSDRAVLRMHGAQEVNAKSAPHLYAMVQRLALQAGLPMPRVYIIDTPQPNAFATGRDPNHAAVAATTGLLRNLSREELVGVMAHELAHIQNRDTLIMTVTATLAGALSMLANFGLWFGSRRNLAATLALMIFAPLAASLTQLGISRVREFAADRRGAEICGNPIWLAAALHKINRLARQARLPSAEQNPATAHMFILNPLSGSARSLFSTHPDVRQRIERLERQG